MNDQEAAIREFEQNEERRYRTGRIIVMVIAAIELVIAIVNVVADFNLFRLLISLALIAALVFGVSWVRYLCAISAGLNVVGYLFILLGGADFSQSTAPGLLIGLYVLLIAYNVATAAVLLFNKSVKEFLYAQKHG